MTRTFAITGILALFALSACNTVSGVGEDVQAGGAAIEQTAEKVKRQTY
jgi:entericidin B